MTALGCTATCPACGAHLELVQAVVRSFGTEALSIFRCAGCGTDWSIEAMLRPMRPRSWDLTPGRQHPREVAECGTESGYRAHRRRLEAQCAACKAAPHAAERRRNAQRARSRGGIYS